MENYWLWSWTLSIGIGICACETKQFPMQNYSRKTNSWSNNSVTSPPIEANVLTLWIYEISHLSIKYVQTCKNLKVLFQTRTWVSTFVKLGPCLLKIWAISNLSTIRSCLHVKFYYTCQEVVPKGAVLEVPYLKWTFVTPELKPLFGGPSSVGFRVTSLLTNVYILSRIRRIMP